MAFLVPSLFVLTSAITVCVITPMLAMNTYVIVDDVIKQTQQQTLRGLSSLIERRLAAAVEINNSTAWHLSRDPPANISAATEFPNNGMLMDPMMSFLEDCHQKAMRYGLVGNCYMFHRNGRVQGFGLTDAGGQEYYEEETPVLYVHLYKGDIRSMNRSQDWSIVDEKTGTSLGKVEFSGEGYLIDHGIEDWFNKVKEKWPESVLLREGKFEYNASGHQELAENETKQWLDPSLSLVPALDSRAGRFKITPRYYGQQGQPFGYAAIPGYIGKERPYSSMTDHQKQYDYGWYGPYNIGDYLLFTTCMTAHADGQFVGVTCIDIRLSKFQSYLQEFKQAKNEVVFIATADEKLVASSDGGVLICTEKTDTVAENCGPRPIALSENELLATAGKDLSQTEFEHNGKTYRLATVKYTGFKLDLIAGVIVPEDNYLGDTEYNTIKTVIIAAAIALGTSLLAAVFIHGLMVKPLRRVVLGILRMGDMDLAGAGLFLHERESKCKSKCVVAEIHGLSTGAQKALTSLETWHDQEIAKRQQLQVEKEAYVQKQITLGLAGAKQLGHPMVLVPGEIFQTLPRDLLMSCHEGLRNAGELMVLDSLKAITAFKNLGMVIIFFSYECVSWDRPGPSVLQQQYMQASLVHLGEKYHVTVDKLFVWLDILSIPQVHGGLKRLALDSLYCFAGLSNAFVIIAPDCVHNNTHEPRGAFTYKDRVWCRTEQLAHYCQNGLDSMLLFTGASLQALTQDWIETVAPIFEGQATCCRKHHPNGVQCDKESLVPTLLGLYFDVYTQMKSGTPSQHIQTVSNLIVKQKASIYPTSFEYNKQDGSTEVRDLFGDLVVRIEEMVDTDVAAALAKVLQATEHKCAFLPIQNASNNTGPVVPTSSPAQIIQNMHCTEV